MELWIRSQDKKDLICTRRIYVHENTIRTNVYEAIGFAILGKYKTNERALKVLDEIQSLLQPIIEYKPIVQEEHNPTYKYKHFVKVDDNMEIKELSTFVYQMPAE